MTAGLDTRPRGILRHASRTLRGLGIIELVVVLAVVLVVSTVVLYRFDIGQTPGDDARARSSLITFSGFQEEAFRRGLPPLTASDITSGEFDRGSAQFTTGASSGPESVSVAIDGTVVVGATASGGGACWAVRMDQAPTPVSPLLWWFLDENAASCTAASFLDPVFPADGSGSDPTNPSVL